MANDRYRRRTFRSNPWKDKVRDVYSSLTELRAYDRMYGIVGRLGYSSAKKLWDDNPVIGGSVHPEDLRVMRRHERLPRRGSRLPASRRKRRLTYKMVDYDEQREGQRNPRAKFASHAATGDAVKVLVGEWVTQEFGPRGQEPRTVTLTGRPEGEVTYVNWQTGEFHVLWRNVSTMERGEVESLETVEMGDANTMDSMRIDQARRNPDDDYPEKTEPGDDDIVINDSEQEAFYAGKLIAETAIVDWDDLSRQIVGWMNRNKYWPDVWSQDDHGGWNLVTADVQRYARGERKPTHPPTRSERASEIRNKLRQTVRSNTGEPDQDYDHAFFDEIVRQLSKSGFKGAFHKEFDKYQGVYLSVPSIDTFWITDSYSTGKPERVRGEKWKKEELIDPEGYPVSSSRGDYFTLPKDHVFEGYLLRLLSFDGKWTEIEDPTVGDLPDILEVQRGPSFKKGSRIDVTIFSGEETGKTAAVVTTEAGDVDASELAAACKDILRNRKL